MPVSNQFSDEQKAQVTREAMELYPIVMVPSRLDNNVPVDANRKNRLAWMAKKFIDLSKQ